MRLSVVVSVWAPVSRLPAGPLRETSVRSDRSNPVTGSLKTIWIESTGVPRGSGVTSMMSAVGAVASVTHCSLVPVLSGLPAGIRDARRTDGQDVGPAGRRGTSQVAKGPGATSVSGVQRGSRERHGGAVAGECQVVLAEPDDRFTKQDRQGGDAGVARIG